MKSYASLERFEGNHVFFEVELHEIEESVKLKASEKETRMTQVSLGAFPDEEYSEGDIVIVDHECGFIFQICGKDEEEKRRRIENIAKMRKVIRGVC